MFKCILLTFAAVLGLSVFGCEHTMVVEPSHDHAMTHDYDHTTTIVKPGEPDDPKDHDKDREVIIHER